MKKRYIAGIVVAGVIIVVFLGLPAYILFGVTVKDTDDVSYYQVLSGEKAGEVAIPVFGAAYVECPYELPKLSELEPYKDYRFNHMAKRMSLFQSDAYVLVVSFNEEHYEAQKTALAGKYAYCTAQSQGFAEGDISEYQYELDGFALRAVEGGRYPKEMLFIGTCDQRQEIVIVYFYNQDLDYMEDPLGKFLENETGWRKVV